MNHRRIALILWTLLLIAWTLYMGTQTSGRPALVLELSHGPKEIATALWPEPGSIAQTPAELRKTVAQNVAAYLHAITLDNLFLFLYPMQFGALIWFAVNFGDPTAARGWRIAGWTAVALMFAAGAADFEENRRATDLLHVAEPALTVPLADPVPYEEARWAVRSASLVKWLLFGLACGAFGVASKRLLTREGETKSAAACLINLLLVVGSALCLTGVALEYATWIVGRAFIGAGVGVYSLVELVVLYKYIYQPGIAWVDARVGRSLSKQP